MAFSLISGRKQKMSEFIQSLANLFYTFFIKPIFSIGMLLSSFWLIGAVVCVFLFIVLQILFWRSEEYEKTETETKEDE